MARILKTNLAESTLASGINSSVLSFTVATGEGALFPNPGSGEQMKVRINDEIILCDSRSGDVFTVNASGRGHESTTAAAHSTSDDVFEVATAEDYQTRLLGYPAEEPVTADDAKALVWDDTAGEFVFPTVSVGMVRLADTDLASDTASVSFSSIAGSYKHLRIVGKIKTDRSGTVDVVDMQIGNSTVDTGTNYEWYTHGESATATDYEAHSTGDDHIEVALCPCAGGSSDADAFGSLEITIVDYTATAEYRPIHVTWSSLDVDWRLGSAAGIWRNTANAVDIVTLTPQFGSNFKAGTRLTLYGMN